MLHEGLLMKRLLCAIGLVMRLSDLQACGGKDQWCLEFYAGSRSMTSMQLFPATQTEVTSMEVEAASVRVLQAHGTKRSAQEHAVSSYKKQRQDARD